MITTTKSPSNKKARFKNEGIETYIRQELLDPHREDRILIQMSRQTLWNLNEWPISHDGHNPALSIFSKDFIRWISNIQKKKILDTYYNLSPGTYNVEHLYPGFWRATNMYTFCLEQMLNSLLELHMWRDDYRDKKGFFWHKKNKKEKKDSVEE